MYSKVISQAINTERNLILSEYFTCVALYCNMLCFANTWVSQKFGNILVVHKAQFGCFWCFYRGLEDDQPYWSVRCCVRLILSEYYSLDLPRSWRWPTILVCEMPCSPDTFRVLLIGFAEIVKVTNLAVRYEMSSFPNTLRVPPAGFAYLTRGTAAESMVLGRPNLTRSSRFLRAK